MKSHNNIYIQNWNKLKRIKAEIPLKVMSSLLQLIEHLQDGIVRMRKFKITSTLLQTKQHYLRFCVDI